MTTLRPDLFAGTHIDGTFFLSEASLNELLRAGAPVDGATVSVGADNQLVMRYGILQAAATLPPSIETGASPRLTLTLASFVVAIALRAALRQRYLSISGRRLTIDLANLPGLEAVRPFWSHVRGVDLATDGRNVRVRVVFAIDEDVHA